MQAENKFVNVEKKLRKSFVLNELFRKFVFLKIRK